MLFGKQLVAGSGRKVYCAGNPFGKAGKIICRDCYRHHGYPLRHPRSKRIQMLGIRQRELRLEIHGKIDIIDLLVTCVP